MNSEWRTAQIQELFDLINGFAFKSGDFVDFGIPVLKIKNVKPNKLLLEDTSFVSTEVAVKAQRYNAQRDDLLITMTGNRKDGTPDTWVGKIARFDDPRKYLLNQRVSALRRKKDALVDTRFANYALSSFEYQLYFINSANSSGGQANLSPSVVLETEFILPPLEIQQKIASILGALDDKIELNRRTNATLETLAQTLFKSWFVDFDPVKAKAAGLEPEGLDAETAALFPSGFENSSLGEIPEGWHVGTLEDFILLSKATVTPQSFPDELFDHFSLPAFDAGQIPMQDLGASILSNKTVVQPDCILVSKLNPETPRVWLTKIHPERRAIASTEFLVVVARDLRTKFFVHGILNSDFFTGIFASKVTGTSKSHQRVRPTDVLQAEIIVPKLEVALAFSKLVQPIFEKTLENRHESVRLAATRDSLLPKLLSGELDVTDFDLQKEGVQF